MGQVAEDTEKRMIGSISRSSVTDKMYFPCRGVDTAAGASMKMVPIAGAS